MNLKQMLEERGIKEEQFRAYFGLDETVPAKVWAHINLRTSDSINILVEELLNDEKIVAEIKAQPYPYEQTVFEGCEGMPEPPTSDKEKK